MIELIFVVCSLLNADACSEKSMTFFTNETISSCMFQAQPRLAHWVSEHPNMRIAKFRCARPEQVGKDI